MRLLIKSMRFFTYCVKPCSCWAATAVSGLAVAACCCCGGGPEIADSAETMVPVDPVNPALVVLAIAAKFLCWAAVNAATAFSG